MTPDSEQRRLATDPQQSFIVQAPAGSGKTEMLTQRFLRLLSLVKSPENIIALTFTRKAANEMRERILLALNKAAANINPTSPHQEQTFAFAKAALQRDEELGWQLQQQPHRLRIVTIDSLCQSLTQAIPLTENQLPYADITDEPKACYWQAARACLAHALAHQELHPAIQTLLSHLDNRQDRLLELFSKLLESRDQWLEILFKAKTLDKAFYEKSLKLIEQHELERLLSSLPSYLGEDLCQLCRQLALVENDPLSSRYALTQWQTFSQMNRQIAYALSKTLLTTSNQLRQGFDHHVGLKKGGCDNALFYELKEKSKQLLAELRAIPEFSDALIRVSHLPAPEYDPEQWQVLQALLALLPLLAAHLNALFSDANLSDFTAITQQALLALGEEDEPTDLTLYLDNTIQHLLVDEFQDTSIQQFRLLQKLVYGWEEGDGRTLFVVGDPMQSIYRFRQAEVGLFLKAKQQGIGSVTLQSLELCCNFRSKATIVNWVNHHFQSIFPQQDDVESGAISFHPSTHVHEATQDSFVSAFQYPDREREAQALVALVKEELNRHADDQIAILVRSRNHLRDIIRLLRENNLPFQGVEIEQLSSLVHLKDIWSLTQALLFPANRLAWLSLLRSPWCGLSLTDLHVLANVDKKQSIYHALQQLDTLPQLSEEGFVRANYFFHVMQDALSQRQQQPLVDWIAATASKLQGDLILDGQQKKDLEQFWLLLDKHSQDGQIRDLALFKEAMNQLYSKQVTPSRLQIMTIHKSKGLEFDSVILPGLGNKPPNRDQPLLRFLKLPSQKHQAHLLISPIRAAHKKQCLLYDYLGKLDAEKEGYELQRLLYVAATRAKKRLYLLDSQEKEDKKSTFRSLLKQQHFLAEEGIEINAIPENAPPALWRLPIDYYRQPPTPAKPDLNIINLAETNSNARQVGIITHELLQWICTFHPSTTDELPWPLIHNRLKQYGLEESLPQCQEQMDKLFKDPIGLWICQAHMEEKNEYELLVSHEGQIQTRIIDRTFYDEGLRWVIDFKTGSDMDDSQSQHQQQVNGYAKLLSQLYSEPIHCGLYYLASGLWVHWEAKPPLI